MQLLNRSGLIRIGLFTAVLVSLFFVISKIVPNVDLRPLLQGETRYLIIISLLIVFFHFFLEPLRWYLYTKETPTEASPIEIRFATVFSVLSATALFSYTMPFKLGLPTRIYLMKVYFGLGVKRIIYILAVDGFINLAIWGFFGAICFIYLLPISDIADHYVYVLAGVVIVAIVAYFGRNSLLNIARPLLDREYEVSKKTIGLSASLVTADVIGFGLRHFAIFLFLGLPMTFLDAFLIGILSVFAGIASTLPMGLGAYDATLIFLLTRHGIPLDVASLAPILNRILNLLSSMIFGGTSSIFLMRTSPAPQNSD